MNKLLLLLFLTIIGCSHAIAQSSNKIKELQKQRGTLQKEITESEKLLSTTRKDVRSQLSNLALLDGQIDKRRVYLKSIESDIKTLLDEIRKLEKQLKELRYELTIKKREYVKSMKYMHRSKSIQNQLIYIFSAEKITQMYRRLRYVREYSIYQRVQGEQIVQKQEQLTKKVAELEATKTEKDTLLNEGKREREKLELQHKNRGKMVANLQKKQKELTNEVSKKKKQNQSLDNQIDKLIAAEIEAAKKKAEEKARKEAAARKAADDKLRAEAEARRKAAALSAAENEKRVAEAKLAEAKALQAQRDAANKSPEEIKAAQKTAEMAKARTAEAVAKKDADAKIAAAVPTTSVTKEKEYANTANHHLTGSFESNKGKLIVPISGSYVIGGRFGSYSVAGLKNVQLDNKGMTFIGRSGAKARAIFQGEVSAIFQFDGHMNVMVRHGNYISVYCNLSSVNVRKGQKVNARDELGAVADNGSGSHVLDFQLRKETAKLNPEVWIGR